MLDSLESGYAQEWSPGVEPRIGAIFFFKSIISPLWCLSLKSINILLEFKVSK